MEFVFVTGLYILGFINLITLFALFSRANKSGSGETLSRLDILESHIYKLDELIRAELRASREELSNAGKESRLDLRQSMIDFRQELKDTLMSVSDQNRLNSSGMQESIKRTFAEFQDSFDRNVHSFNELQREKFVRLEQRLHDFVVSAERRLEEMRITVDEKLQKTLHERVGQSFEMVNRHLESVQKGLGEMRLLAQDVGGLKKVLSNVRARGLLGELQLRSLLEQILSPVQYSENVRTKSGSSDVVEFAIRFPGKNEVDGEVFLPVDSKFPLDVYYQVLDAYENGDLPGIEQAGKQLEQTIKKCARDIRDKYIDPPRTTDFAVIFLPVEGLYAEVVRRTNLIELLQREMKIVITGPTTFAAMLNSFHLGFRTLAIQKRSGEVWQVLAAVKTEFANFAGMLQKAKGNIDTASGQLEQVLGVRTRAIERKLKEIEAASPEDSARLLGDDEDLRK